MPIGAVVGAVGAVASAGIGAYASGKASDQQAAAQRNALQTQERMFGQAKEALNPFITAGTNVLPDWLKEIQGGAGTYGETLKGLITPGTSAEVLATMPGFQFQSQYGQMAATNALAARGLGGSAGPVARAIGDYTTGLAGTYWKDSVSALQSAYNSKVGALQNYGNMGADAAKALATGAITSGNNQAATWGNIGNAQAAGTLGQANALNTGITGASNAYTNYAMMDYLKNAQTAGGGGSPGLYSLGFANPLQRQ